MINTKTAIGKILSRGPKLNIDKCSKSLKRHPRVGDVVSWEYGDGTAKVLSTDNRGVTFLVSGFNRELPGSNVKEKGKQVRKSWDWIEANPGFLER